MNNVAIAITAATVVAYCTSRPAAPRPAWRPTPSASANTPIGATSSTQCTITTIASAMAPKKPVNALRCGAGNFVAAKPNRIANTTSARIALSAAAAMMFGGSSCCSQSVQPMLVTAAACALARAGDEGVGRCTIHRPQREQALRQQDRQRARDQQQEGEPADGPGRQPSGRHRVRDAGNGRHQHREHERSDRHAQCVEPERADRFDAARDRMRKLAAGMIDPCAEADAERQRAEDDPVPWLSHGARVSWPRASRTGSRAKRTFCSLPATTCATSSHRMPLAPANSLFDRQRGARRRHDVLAGMDDQRGAGDLMQPVFRVERDAGVDQP